MDEKRCTRSFVGDGDGDDDRISQLPDDILVDILSLLSMKEAGRTSVLSSRWINLWKHIHSLRFDDEIELAKKPKIRSESINSKVIKKYLKWVNSVIQSHKSSTLKLFRICFALDGSHSDSITRWLEFASSRQVQRLELDFLSCNNPYRGYNCYPEVLFAPRSSMQLFDFKSLKALTLRKVKMSSGAIEFFLRNCPLLEQLIVHLLDENISKIEVCGSSLVLKHLEVVHCLGLESLKVSAPSLTSLWVASLTGLLLENVPMLVDVCVPCEDDSISLRSLFSALSCCISQLETLHLSLRRYHEIKEEDTDELSKFPKMPRLKKLFIQYYSSYDESLIRLALLTRAAPYLQEFVLMNELLESHRTSVRVDDVAATIEFRHHHLKVFEFCGYHGRTSDDALVRYMLENCVVLERIVIDPSVTFSDRLKAEEIGRNKAKKHLQPQLPQHVELVIL